VIPFPRRQVFAWMAAAAGVFMAVTLWSVSRLGGDRALSSVARSTSQAEAPAPLAVPPAPPPAAPAAEADAPRSRLEDGKAVDQVAARAPAVEERSIARQEQDKRKRDSHSDALARADLAAAQATQAAQAPATSAGNTRAIQQQVNTVAAGGARPRGPLAIQANQANQANQQANQQQYAQPVPAPQAPPLAKSPPPPPQATPTAPAVASATPAPAPTPPAEPGAPAAQADAAAATRERTTNEQLAESVTITSGASARRTPPRSQPERSQAAGTEREGQARSKDEAATFKAFGSVAAASTVSSFAEPGGRLRWRIADGLRLESSSDGGTTWTRQYTARDRLRAGTAPAIDSAWAVGERGLVLRFVVPGGWAEVSRPAAATLIAVSAISAQSARVTADDGRVFQTADGGATWTPVAPGAGPQ
jgi:hypothetical protein